MVSTKNRPTGIVIIAVLWTLSSISNIYQGLNTIITDLGYLQYLSNPNVSEWYSFGLPAEIVLGFFIVAFGFLTLLVVYGLYTAKSWSYGFAFAIPVFIAIINLVTMGLYAFAPVELEFRDATLLALFFVALNLIWGIIIWVYLTKPHVKQYLKQIPSPSPVPVPPPPVDVATSEEKKFCRYCGAENKTDADFCEKCGKKIG